MSDAYPALSNKEAVDHAIGALQQAGVRFTKKTAFQIKIGPFNYYPVKGTIYRDGETEARETRGLDAFMNLLRKSGLAPAASHRETCHSNLRLPADHE